MRAPSGSKHPPGGTNINGGTGSLSSAGSRSSNRRRDVRSGKVGQGDNALGKKGQKKVMEPYGESTLRATYIEGSASCKS